MHDEQDVEDRYRLLVDLMPDGVVVHQDGQVKYVNASTARLLATTADQLVGRPILDYIHPDSRGPLLERIAGLVEPGVPSEPTRVQQRDHRHRRARDGDQLEPGGGADLRLRGGRGPEPLHR